MKILNQADAIEDPTDKWPQAEPDNRDFEDIIAPTLRLTGVVSGCAVTAQGTPDMTVAVASGVVIVDGTAATVTSGNVTITAAGAQPRFDLVCASSAGVKSAVLGSGSTNPVFPDPGGKAVLAAVYVPGSDTDIDSNQIVDKRIIIKPWVQLSGDTMTGNFVISKSASESIMDVQGSTQNSTLRVSAWGDVSGGTPMPSITMRRFRGTIAAPLRTQSADLIGRIGATGSHAASDVAAATLLTTATSFLEFRAGESFTSTAYGSYMRFFTTGLLSTTATERMRLKTDGELQMDDIQGYATTNLAKIFAQKASTNRTATVTGGKAAIYGTVTRYGSGTVTDAEKGVQGVAADHANCVSRTITGAANNGSGLIRITTSASHTYSTGDRISIGNVLGTTEANAAWTITAVDATRFDLQGSTFTNAYVSGGSATNAGVLQAGFFYVYPVATRVLSAATGTATYADDVLAVGGYNAGTAKGADCFYVARNATNFAASSEWITGMTIDAWADYGIRINGTYANYGIDLYPGTFTLGQIRLKNATAGIVGRNAANNANLTMMYLSSGNEMVLGLSGQVMNVVIPTTGGLRFGIANITFDATTGTKIGTATTEKFAFHNSTPVIQKASAAQAAVATTAAVNTTPYGYTTAAQADAIVTLVNELRAALVEKGLIKGAA